MKPRIRVYPGDSITVGYVVSYEPSPKRYLVPPRILTTGEWMTADHFPHNYPLSFYQRIKSWFI